MTVKEFKSCLNKGLGRAILLLRHEPDKEPFREAVWNHAIHDPRYDRQCNASRGKYIMNLFDCFPDGDNMLNKLLSVYGEGEVDAEDTRYYINNLGEMIEHRTKGAEPALDSLYRVLFHELLTLPNTLTNGCDNERDNYCFAALRRYRHNRDVLEELVRDGVTLLLNSDRYNITMFTDFFDNEIQVSKTEEFAAILAALEKEDSSYKAVFDDYRRESAELPIRWGLPKEDPLTKPTNWREAIDYVVPSRGNRIRPVVEESLWQNLSADDKAEIARLVEEETDLSRRCVLISQLRRMGGDVLKSYPRDPSPLLTELEASTESFPISNKKNRYLWELSMLTAEIRHPAVREFALRLLPHYGEKHGSISFHRIVRAFINNLQPEDADTLEAFVTSVTDSDMLHDIGMEILYPAIHSLIPESVLLYLYENEPCSSCRNRVFLSLMARYRDMTNLPEALASIREEAKLDCDYGTRLIARGQSIRKGEV